MNTKSMIAFTKTLKLLYVEDDERARSTMVEVLENFFTDITVAVDGSDGFEKFQQNQFDLVISDINMPKLNGIEMLRKIRDIDEEISFLFLSAHNESEYFIESIELNVDGYILKPINIQQFKNTLKKITQKIMLLQENENYKLHLEEEVAKKTQEIRDKLYYDDLTTLHSRYAFFEDIKRIDTPIVLLIDINKFKLINEIYGTSIGSFVLEKFAMLLKNFTKNSTYSVYRLASDEFAFLDKIAYIDPEKYEDDIEKIFTTINYFQIDLENDTITIEITVGIATAQKDSYESAKIALNYAKKNKQRYAMFSSAIDKRLEAKNTLIWKDKIKYAIENNLVTPVYQQIVDKDRNVIKSETLMRLKEKDLDKLISPYFFLDIAVKTSLYNELSSYIIFEGLHLLGTSSHTLSFNFTYGDIKNKLFLEEIEEFFKKSPNLGKRAVFEITENESMKNYDDVKKFLKRFRKYGITFAIDDFGSGYSSFEYILEIEPDYLKIDGTLVKNIETDKKAYALVKAIVQFSHELGMKVIAEYVHSEAIFEVLKTLDVDEYQGFYFYEPQEVI